MKRTVEEVIELLKADQGAIVNSLDQRFAQVKQLIELLEGKRFGVAFRWVMNEEDEEEDEMSDVFAAKIHPDVYDFLVRENKFVKKNIKITLRKGMEKRAAEGLIYVAQLSPDTSPELMTRTLNMEVENAVREWIKQFLDITMDAPAKETMAERMKKPAKRVEEDDPDDDEMEERPPAQKAKKPTPKSYAFPQVARKEGMNPLQSLVKPMPFSDVVELANDINEQMGTEIETEDEEGTPRDANDVIREILQMAKGYNEDTKKYERALTITKDDMLSAKSYDTLKALGYEVK